MSAIRTHLPGPGELVRAAWERLSVYLPIILMGFMALGTYWLARNTPMIGMPEAQRPLMHEPDYLMRGFSVKVFDPTGRLKGEVQGVQARHYPDNDTLEIDQPHIRAINPRGELTVATARRALSNADGSEVQLFGNAVVTREAAPTGQGAPRPPLEFRSEFIHAFMQTERVKSNQPVQLTRGADRFTADSMDYDNIEQVLELRGRVRGVLVPAARP